jgi:hypothetical protein
MKELIDQRFNNKTLKSGVPWFWTAIGARLQAQISGVVCSKQTWSYKCIERPITLQNERPLLDPYGQPYVDQETGEPILEMVEEDGIEKDVRVDRPDITLIPAEMVLMDPNTSWPNPVQQSPTLIVQHPMHVDAVKAMMKDEKGFTPWREVQDEELRQGYFSEAELLGVKAAREGSPAQTAMNRANSRFGGLGNEIVDVWDCFFRRDGIDYQCWTIRNRVMLSDPIPVEEAHPALTGQRPYVLGTDSLEVFKLYPESHVHAWRQTQDEINDFANLTMDGTRLSVYPTAKVVAGRNIDYKAVQRRDAQGLVLVKEPNDVTWDRPTANTQGSDRMVQLLSNDFDELAGIFSQNSVESNRHVGDTVGGMQLIAGSANATSEFDLRVFVETWAEQVLSQIVMLEQYYEDDETLLAISGNKAKLFQRHGVDHVTDELLESQVTMSLNIGVGGSDPMQALIKFKGLFDILMPMLGLAMKEGKAEIVYEEIFNEVFAKGGFKNGAERFIKMKEGGQQQIPPEMVQQLMGKLQELQAEIKELRAGHQAKLQQTQLHEQGETQRTAMKTAGDLKLQDDQQVHDERMKAIDALVASAMPRPTVAPPQ